MSSEGYPRNSLSFKHCLFHFLKETHSPELSQFRLSQCPTHMKFASLRLFVDFQRPKPEKMYHAWDAASILKGEHRTVLTEGKREEGETVIC